MVMSSLLLALHFLSLSHSWEFISVDFLLLPWRNFTLILMKLLCAHHSSLILNGFFWILFCLQLLLFRCLLDGIGHLSCCLAPNSMDLRWMFGLQRVYLQSFSFVDLFCRWRRLSMNCFHMYVLEESLSVGWWQTMAVEPFRQGRVTLMLTAGLLCACRMQRIEGEQRRGRHPLCTML